MVRRATNMVEPVKVGKDLFLISSFSLPFSQGTAEEAN
jgi:hypothetical protein